jgi:acetylornithine deacetylase/succinyl-diaminopimelate desuccinylase-like protein
MEARGVPTVLVYGHYDVQPADPLEEWDTDPFDPAQRGDYLVARGASDMKGQLMAFLRALEAYREEGGYPVNLRWLLEGEEEVGSPNLGSYVDAHRDALGCDVVLNLDSGVLTPAVPAIVYGLRGLAYFELEVHGPKRDLHSGMFGGAIHNPVQALCELIAALHDAEGRITLPGFYDKVRPLTEDERAELARLPHNDAEWLQVSGAPALWGEAGYSTLERIGARPTLEINGILGGFTGEGEKTVLPARAMAKLSMRLVPDQKGAEIAGQLRAFLEANAPDTITWELRELAAADPALTERDSPAMEAAKKALAEAFGAPPVFKREGGSVPVVAMLQEKLGVDSVLLGFALPDDGIHGPNERQHLPTHFRGIEAYARFLHHLGAGD